MSEYRSLKMTIAAGVKTRTETFNGREHLVVPVVALVEGVIHAMNARNAELVTLEEYGKAPGGWNGRPLFSGHPMVDGAPVSGNSPEILETLSIGLVFNAGIVKDKLTMEAWIDVLKADEVDPTLLERIRAGKAIEISVGVFVRTDDEAGTYQGKKYLGKWAEIVPDHLALLAETDEGACSRKMGCGVRAAKGEQNVSKKKIDKTGAGLFARIMATFRASQPAVEQSDNDVRRKLYEELKEVEPACNYVEAVYSDLGQVVYSVYSAGMGPYTLSLYRRTFVQAADGTITLGDTREEVEPVLTYEPVEAEEATDEVLAAAATKKVQAMHDHAVALGATCAPYAAGAAPKAAGSCGCGKHPAAASTSNTNKEQEIDMNKQDRIKALIGEGKGTFTEADRAMLEAADEATLGRFEAAQTAQVTALKTATDAAQASATEVTTLKAASAPKTATFEELLGTADPATRELISSGRAMGQARKDASIKLLKDSGRCKITDAKLTAMSQAELDELVSLANITVPTVASVDFSGNGAPRSGASNNEVPPPPDLFAALRAKK